MKNKVIIRLKDWDHTCSDNCCHDYGCSIEVNGVKCDNEYAGVSVEQSLEFTLNQLGYEVEIIPE